MTLIGCEQSNKKKQTTTISATQNIQDTIVVKQKNVLKPFEIGFRSKSYSYYWLAGKDTLDFSVDVYEYESDSTVSLDVYHNKKLMLFSVVLRKINECLPLIKEDFNLSKFSFIDFNEPLYYLDLAKKLSSEYEQKFERKNVSYEKLNQFLLQSSLTLQLDSVLNPLNKKVKSYGMEKFGLMGKKYYKQYLYDNLRVSNIDFTEYPEFTISSMGMAVELEN